ncbi:MAG: DUF2336 domain-containing protein [Ferrovibrio sp.]|uniref:DUF2336 domain-containing protein n=1 Tax=Ferrovibrio sp. TaxID=1917215 RepID=UPI00260C6CCD|nr:DUF2336 domain-containing protein [Ferrovibrio sp.]MCW0236526.1 DUF2336 domain-containing protein [Ferrovibrio sp.]
MSGKGIDYDKAKALAASADAVERLKLATRADTQPEILYYLAIDQAEEVRRAIADNEATPAQAHLLLANDESEEVRRRLAAKVARLLPDMPDDEASKARELAIQTLELLAQDELARIRATLSEALKASENVPHHLIKQLALDVELIVSAPVLQFSPLLSDDDLREIVASSAQSGALSAIARRVGLSEGVSGVIAATRDVSAVTALLANGSAQIREETLDLILDAAPGVEVWHEPLVQRPNLPGKAAKRLAGFVAGRLLKLLTSRRDLPADVLGEIRQVMEKRLEVTLEEADEEDEAQTPMAEAEARVKKLIRDKKLDNDVVQEAIENGDRNLVLQALIQNGRIPLSVIKKAIDVRNGRLITALVWRAKFSMRTAVMIQRDLAHVPPRMMLNARNGSDYPMTEAELQDQLKILGL